VRLRRVNEIKQQKQHQRHITDAISTVMNTKVHSPVERQRRWHLTGAVAACELSKVAFDVEVGENLHDGICLFQFEKRRSKESELERTVTP